MRLALGPMSVELPLRLDRKSQRSRPDYCPNVINGSGVGRCRPWAADFLANAAHSPSPINSLSGLARGS